MKKKVPAFVVSKSLAKVLGIGLCSAVALLPSKSCADGAEIMIQNNPGTQGKIGYCEADLIQGSGSSLPFNPGINLTYPSLEVYVLSGTNYSVLTTNFQGNFTLPLGINGPASNIDNYLNFSFSPSDDGSYPSNYLTTAEICIPGNTNYPKVLDVGSNFLASGESYGSFDYPLPSLSATNATYGTNILNIVPKSLSIENLVMDKTNKNVSFNIIALPGETLDLYYTTNLTNATNFTNGSWSPVTNLQGYYVSPSISNFGTNVSIPMTNLPAKDKMGFYGVRVE
jgi:hypothetical protein